MATVTSGAQTSVLDGYHGDGPRYRLEHASNGSAGELRIATNTLFDGNGEHRWYLAWRHWACATKHQLKGLKEVTENDATKAPGYDRLSPEAQEQVRLAFENDQIVDKTFKGVREDLAGKSRRYDGEILNADGYKADVATRAAGCRFADCPGGGEKILKGELRLGISVPFDGDHSSWVYKHWTCMSQYDLEAIRECYSQDSFDASNTMSEELQKVVVDTIETGEIIEPPKPPEVTPKTKKSSKKKKDAKDDGESEAPKLPEAVLEPEAEAAAHDGELDPHKPPEVAPEAKKSIKNEATVEDSELEPPKPPEVALEPKKEAAEDDGNLEPSKPTKVVPKSKKSIKKEAAENDGELEPHKLPGATLKAKKSIKNEGTEDDGELAAPERKSKSKRKAKSKGKGKKRVSEDMDTDSEPEYVPRKTRSRAAPVEEPEVARI